MGKRYCCVGFCPNRYQTGNLSLFLPPKDPHLFAKWQQAVSPFKKEPLARYNSICELHFKPEQILREYTTKVTDGTIHRIPRSRVTLKRGAYPTIFQHDSDRKMKSEVTFIIEPSDDFESEDTEGSSEQQKNSNSSSNVPVALMSRSPHSSDVISINSLAEQRNTSKIDIRSILGEKSDNVPFNEDSFDRFCRAHIISNVAKTGRPSKFNRKISNEQDLINESSTFGEEFVLYPTIRHLDVLTLIHNIEVIGFPSDDWFCTLKDGAPAFLCWDDDFKIRKKIVFNAKNLDPTIIIDDEEMVINEIVKPRSLKEVNSILLLVDSLRICPQKFTKKCKGYYFCNNQDMTMCNNCIDASILDKTESCPQSYSFDLVRQSADAIVASLYNWSYSITDDAVIFMLWGQNYSVDKKIIIDDYLDVKVMFDDMYVNIQEIPSPNTIEDLRSFVEYVDTVQRCSKIDSTRLSDNCLGYVSPERQRLRMTRCTACAKNKKMSIKPKSSDVQNITLLEKDGTAASIANMQYSPFADVIPLVALPNCSWSYTTLKEAAIFQNWETDFTVVKRVIVHSDFSLLIYLDDNIVKIVDMQQVSTADDITNVLEMVDRIELCEGYNEAHKKAAGCLGFTFDELRNEKKLRRCDNCLAECKFRQSTTDKCRHTSDLIAAPTVER